MRKLTLFLTSLFVSIAMFAQTQMSGEYTVGTGGTYDYASLADAGMAIKSAEFTGDVTLLICTDLTETINTGIVNKSEYTLTIRPDKDENRTITYTTATDNTGPTGVFVIGGDMTKTPGSTIGWASIPTKNVIVDGAAAGYTTPRLKITNEVFGTNVLLYGDVQDVIIRNCILVGRSGSKTAYALAFRSENYSQTSKNIGPKNCVAENCIIESASTQSQVIYCQGNQANSYAGHPTNITIRNCSITSHLRGAFLYGVNGMNIEGCTFNMLETTAGYMCHGILGNTVKGKINVKGNKFIKNTTKNASAGEFGLQTITASGGADVWVIENNYFAGYDALASGTTSKESRLVGVRCGDSCVVRHNTFHMPKLTYAPGTSLVSTQAVALLWLAGSKQYPVQNNIFVCEETTANVSLIRGGLNENVTGNVFYHKGGNAAIVAAAPSCMTFADLETSYPTQAATSKWTNVTFTDVANGDLSLAGASDGDANLAVDRLADVLTDINGKSRAEQTYVGAYEGSAFTTPVVNYTVTVTAKNGTVTGAGEYEEGKEATLTATPANGYKFVNWTKGEEIVSTKNPYTFVVTADVALVANFAAVEPEPVVMTGIVKRALQNGENVIVLTHEADGTPHIYNIVKGEAYEVSQEGVVPRDPENVGDYLSISDIAVTDDGKLVACNYIRCQNADAQVDAGYMRGTNRFYIWDELTGGAREWFTEQFAGNSYRADAGYTMALKGSSTDCNILVTVRHYNNEGAGGSDGSVRMHYFTIAGGAKPSRIYLGSTIKPTAPYYTHTIGENMLLSASPLATKNFIMDADLTAPSEFKVGSNGTDVTILGRLDAEVVTTKFNGVSYVTYDMKTLAVAPYADAEGKLAGVKVIDVTTGFATAQVVKVVDLDTPVAATAAATAVAVEENGLTITLVADAEVHTLTVDLNLKPTTYTVTATANIAERGYIEGLENEGVYEAGTKVTLRAVANESYEFVKWNIDNKIVGLEEEYTFTVTADVEIVAHFKKSGVVEIIGVVKRALQNGENVIILTHEPDATPHIYNIAGETITEVSQEGVVPVDPANEYDYLSISDIALTDDGKLVACNYIRCAAADPSVGTTRYYIWNDLAEAPALWFTSHQTGNSTRGDVGYTFAVKGVSTNAQVMTTAVHNINRAARINLHTIVNGEETNYHRFGLHTTESYFTEAKRGVQFQLSTTPLEGIWSMDGDLANPAGFTVPSDKEAGYDGIELPAEAELGKKYNGASYVKYNEETLMVAPYADAEGKLAGVKVIDITAGFDAAQPVKVVDLDAPVAATTAATAVKVVENGLTVTLVGDATLYTLNVELTQDPGPGTAVDNTVVAPQVDKILRNGQVLIIRDGKTYNMMGQEVK